MQQYQVEERSVYPAASEGDPAKLLELGESEIILHTRRQGNGIIVAVGTPVEVEYECGAPLKSSDGTCSRKVGGPDERCAQHTED